MQKQFAARTPHPIRYDRPERTEAMTTMTTEPTFLYPTSRQYPFDKACEQIVRELEKRDWRVPGMTVEFFENGHGDEKYRYLSKVSGDDFVLRFGRRQGRFGQHWSDSAAINDILIPKWDVSVYEDWSMSVTAYDGDDWQADKERFMATSKYVRYDEKPPLRRKYENACDCSGTLEWHWHEGPPSLVASKDHPVLGRNIDLAVGGPYVCRLQDLFGHIARWLEDNVLSRVLAEPATTARTDYFAREMVPFPDSVGPLYRFADYKDARRIVTGRQNPGDLEPGDRYGSTGSSRTVTVDDSGTATEDEPWARGWHGIGIVTATTDARTLEVPGHIRWTDHDYVVRVTPKWANGISVADNAAYERRRNELFEEIKPRNRLSDAELREAEDAREATIVPIAEYDGSFEQPVAFISRELGFDEVELVRGPWPECAYVSVINDRDDDAKLLLDLVVTTNLASRANYRDKAAKQEHDAALAMLSERFEFDPALIAAATVTTERGTHRKPIQFWKIAEAAVTMKELGLL